MASAGRSERRVGARRVRRGNERRAAPPSGEPPFAEPTQASSGPKPQGVRLLDDHLDLALVPPS